MSINIFSKEKMAMAATCDPGDVPAYAIVSNAVKRINEDIALEMVVYDTSRERYLFYLKLKDRESVTVLSRELLEDLRDNPSGTTSTYSQDLDRRLMDALLPGIEENGLILFNESTLKYKLLQYMHERTEGGKHVHKYNSIGRNDLGDLERFFKIRLSEEEKQILIWAWDELRRLRLIVPTGKDLVNPDDWAIITDKGIAAIEGKEYVDSQEEIFINKGEVYTAYRKIRDLLKGATKELIVIDSYVDESLLDMIAEIGPTVNVMVLTQNLKGNYKNAYNKLRQQRGNVETRTEKFSHERFLVLDRTTCYSLGASIKDAGKTATVIDKKSSQTKDELLHNFDKAWQTAKPV